MFGSPLPLLDIRSFALTGMFKQVVYARFGRIVWVVDFPHARGTAVFEPEIMRLNLQLRGPLDVLVEVGRKPLRYGSRPYFICGECGYYCEQLVRDDGRLLCLTCYRSQSHRFSRSYRNALILEAQEALKAAGSQRRLVYKGRPPEPLKVSRLNRGLAIQARDLPSGDEYNQLLHSLKTETAMIRGQGLSQYHVYEDVMAEEPEFWAQIPIGATTSPPDTPDIVNRYPVLNLNRMREAMSWVQGALCARSLVWGESDMPSYIALLVDWRAARPNILLAYNWHDREERRWQRLEFHEQPDGRVRFICPITGQKCDTLYGRGGIFASRRAQRLYHKSQRVAGRAAVKLQSTFNERK